MPVDLIFGPQDGKRLGCRPGEARTEYHEAATGLRLRVSASGARAWGVVFWSTTAKTMRRLKLGNAAVMPLKQAREKARRALHAVHDEDRDPMAERRGFRDQERAERQRRAEARAREVEERKRQHVTFGKLLEDYVEERRTKRGGKYNRPARPNTVANWKAMIKNHVLPELGARLPETLTSEDFLLVLEGARDNGGESMAPRVRELLSAAWRWIELRPRSLGVTLPSVSPLARLGKVGEAKKERDRVLGYAEIRDFWQATEAEGMTGHALRFSLLTAARVREATELPWEEVDLRAKVWTLPAVRSKGGKERRIPLSVQAVAILECIPRDGDLVFGAVSVFEVMERVRARMAAMTAVRGSKLEDFQARDLRRTAATTCARLGTDPFVVSLVLGHEQKKADKATPEISGVYNRWAYPERVREALDRLGQWVLNLVHGEEPGEVVSIEVRR
jgi:integrase